MPPVSSGWNKWYQFKLCLRGFKSSLFLSVNYIFRVFYYKLDTNELSQIETVYHWGAYPCVRVVISELVIPRDNWTASLCLSYWANVRWRASHCNVTLMKDLAVHALGGLLRAKEQVAVTISWYFFPTFVYVFEYTNKLITRRETFPFSRYDLPSRKNTYTYMYICLKQRKQHGLLKRFLKVGLYSRWLLHLLHILIMVNEFF